MLRAQGHNVIIASGSRLGPTVRGEAFEHVLMPPHLDGTTDLDLESVLMDYVKGACVRCEHAACPSRGSNPAAAGGQTATCAWV